MVRGLIHKNILKNGWRFFTIWDGFPAQISAWINTAGSIDGRAALADHCTLLWPIAVGGKAQGRDWQTAAWRSQPN